MAAITASLVKELREQTGLPMMECKAALTEAEGDNDRAKELLQKKFKSKMASRASHDTGEGRISIHIADDRKSGAIIDLRCETAPVAKTDQFIDLTKNAAKAVAAQDEAEPNVESVLGYASTTNAERTIGDEITEVFGLLRENIKLTKCRKVTGEYLCGYVHHDGKTGTLIALDAKPSSDEIGVDLCHHVVFSNPMAVTRDQIPADQIEKVRRMALEVAESENKPPQIVEKIVEGKVNAFCAENALMDQEHVKVSKEKVSAVLKKGGVNAVTDLCFIKIG